jgi:hypothetical protein
MPEIPSRDDHVTIRLNTGADASTAEVPMNMPLRNDGETIICACGMCGRPFQPVGRQRFFDAACRQKAWRRRHPAPLPAIPARIPRVATVYVCTECDTLYLGEQRCPDCEPVVMDMMSLF